MPEREYLDCEYYLPSDRQASLKVGQSQYSGRLNLDIDNLLHLLSEPPVKSNLSKQGAILFRALFPPDSQLLEGYRSTINMARQQEKRLRFRLHIAPQAPVELHRLNWELLFDEREGRCLSRWPDTPFSRDASVPLQVLPHDIERPKLLVVIAAPADWRELKVADIDRERVRQEITAALAPLTRFMRFEILEPPATPARIRQRLVAERFQAVHIYAHGLLRENPETRMACAHLVLERMSTEGGGDKPHDEEIVGDLIDETVFSEIFAGLGDLRLVTLMTCHGGVQTQDNPFGGLGPILVRQGVPAVIAMKRAVSFVAAQIFTESFYDNLARYGQVDVAVNEARQQVFLTLSGGRTNSAAASAEWSNSVLVMRLADGRLWKPQQTQEIDLAELTAGVNWASIIQEMEAGKVIPIIGPDLNLGLLLSNENIAERWAEEFQYDKYNYPSNNRNDLPRIAQFVETINASRRFPHGRLLRLLKEDLLVRQEVQERNRLRNLTLTEIISEVSGSILDQDEDIAYRILAELPFSTYITSNYDGYLTFALEWVRRAKNVRVKRRRCLWRSNDREPRQQQQYQLLKGTQEEPLVFHLYGDDSESTSLVLTEDDYLNWLRAISKDEWRLPKVLHGSLTDSLLLFLGFNVRDLDFRILFKGLIGDLKEMQLPRIAVLQVFPDDSTYEAEAVLTFLSQDCRDNLDVQIYPGSARNFLVELRNQWERRYD